MNLRYCYAVVDDGQESLPSVTSDGIPIADEYQDEFGETEEERQQYHWNADIHPTQEDENEDEDDEDAELLPPLSPAPAALAARVMANDITTGYPEEEELPEEFAEATVGK